MSISQDAINSLSGDTEEQRVQYETIFTNIAAQVKDGQCNLFLGSAIHSQPPAGSEYTYQKAKSPATGNELSEHLASTSGFLKAEYFKEEDMRNLQRVSLYYDVNLKRNALIQEIRKLVHEDKEPSPVLRGLAELNFPLVITTNYDQLFEKALTQAGRHYDVSTYSAQSNQKTLDCKAKLDSDKTFLLKIHGDIEKPPSIVITDEDYIQFILRMSDKDGFHPVPLNVRKHLTTRTTLFIGYSLKDYNLRLLFKTLRWKIDPASTPQSYSIDRKPDPLILAVWDQRRSYVKFVIRDLWDFVPKLYEAVKGRTMPL